MVFKTGLRASLVLAGAATAAAEAECELYLAESTLSGTGRGVFAGVDYRREEVVAADTAVMVHDQDVKDTQVWNYFYSGVASRAFLSLGYGSLFNHHSPASVENFWRDDKPSEDRRDDNFFLSKVDYYADREIKAGQEIFNEYGTDGWFKYRGVDFISGDEAAAEGTLARSLEELEMTGHCLSDVSVHESAARGVGQGLYAERSFEAGEVVSISPVLFLSKLTLEEAGPTSLLINYAITVPGSDVALLPVGTAGAVNNGGKASSVSLHWYDWNTRTVLYDENLPKPARELNVDELEAAQFASLDICYVATRDIEEGEELSLYYGKEWAREYRSYRKKLKDDPRRGALFRHPIHAPANMFPDSWMVECIGKSCDLSDDDDYAEEEEYVEIREDCGLFMAPSTIPGVGRGLFAGFDFSSRSLLDFAPSITFPLNMSQSTQLINFVFGSEHEDYVMAVLGPVMLINHAENWDNTDYVYATKRADIVDASERLTSPQTTYASLYFSTTTDVFVGEELFTNYGGEQWFNARGIPYDSGEDSLDVDDRSRDIEELSASGHCLTDVAVDDSAIPGAGQGVYAERSFKAGEVVSITPVLILPKHILNDTYANSVMVNYVLSVDGSDVTLLPLGRASMVNNGGKESSLSVHWYDWEGQRVLYDQYPSAALERSIEELEASHFANLDISYVATRDIEEGEELTLNYGPEWEAAWKEYQNTIWRRKQLIHAAIDPPIFRQPIGVSATMFPSSWMGNCIGRDCNLRTTPCDLYMATSTLPGVGRGVFAGKHYHEDDTVDISSTVTFPLETTYQTQLINFIFGSDHEDYIMALLSPGMLLNHHEQHSVNYFWLKDDDKSVPDATTRDYSPYTTYTDIYFQANKPIRAGDEIFTTYGESEWFDSRDIPYRESPTSGQLSRSMRDLKASGHCLTDVAVRPSTIPKAGKGLFAVRSFQAGEVVSISPVLVLPKHVISDMDTNSVLVNYVFSVHGSDVALLPLGRAAMVNNGGDNSSLSVRWYEWETRKVLHGSDMPRAAKELEIDDLEGSPAASLDISFVATRDINQGEELTLNYGERWESTWNSYVESLSNLNSFGNSPKPIFLEPIGLDPHMYPTSWLVPCIGSSCDEYKIGGDSDTTEEITLAKPSFDINSLLKTAKVNKVQWGKSAPEEEQKLPKQEDRGAEF